MKKNVFRMVASQINNIDFIDFMSQFLTEEDMERVANHLSGKQRLHMDTPSINFDKLTQYLEDCNDYTTNVLVSKIEWDVYHQSAVISYYYQECRWYNADKTKWYNTPKENYNVKEISDKQNFNTAHLDVKTLEKLM